MTLFEWTLFPTAVSILGLLLLATFRHCEHREAVQDLWIASALRRLAMTMGPALSIGVALMGLLGSFIMMSNPFGQLVLISAMAVILFVSMRPMQQFEEFAILLLSSVLGGVVCVLGADFVYVLLGLELLTIPIYGLIAFERDKTRYVESAIKYLVLGGASSAFMFLGVAFNYAASGNLGFEFHSPLGAGLFLVGLCFKLSLVPFHLWTPDVYDGAPVPVTAFLATASKLAMLGVLAKLTMPGAVLQAMSVIAMLSMLAGSLLTLRSDRMGRFLAYSSIAHMGYALVAWSVHGNLVLYASAYALSVLVIFWMLSWVFEPSGELQLLGLFYRRPWPAALMIFGLLSLMGLPMTPIFWAKYQVLITTLSTGSVALFGVFVASSLISVYGYARIVTRMCQRV